MKPAREGYAWAVSWDFVAVAEDNEKDLNHWLSSGFEPFAVVPVMRQGIAAPGQMAIALKVYLKKPNMVEVPLVPQEEIPTEV